jgi:hypothetical protein
MSSNTIEGKLIAKLEIEEGISASGNAWQKRNFILETLDPKYPKKICFEAFGERVVQLDSIKVGTKVSVTFDCESREYNNKWYTTLKAWKIE